MAQLGGLRSPDDRIRQIVKQSLQIASDTKRKATAESRLKVAEDALNDLLMETVEDAQQPPAIKSLRTRWTPGFRARVKDAPAKTKSLYCLPPMPLGKVAAWTRAPHTDK